MNRLNKKIDLIFAAIVLASAQLAHATPIADNYVGGNDHGLGDVIGHPADFDIQSMDITRTGNILSVSINTGFAGKGGTLYPGFTFSGKGIGYGDLFLSSAWTPFGTGFYANDNNANGTKWAYGFSLGDRWMATGNGNGTLYSLNSASLPGNVNPDALLSDDFLKKGTFRNGQEVAVNPNGNITALNGLSSWSVDSDSVDFLIDLAGTSLENSNTIALHWGMTCGNDTIEGEYSVPEPAILSLLIAGLAGFGVASKKRKKQ